MSGNARGQLKEEMEGIHRNMEWIKVHSAKAQDLATESHPEIITLFADLIKEMETIDELMQGVYGTL